MEFAPFCSELRIIHASAGKQQNAFCDMCCQNPLFWCADAGQKYEFVSQCTIQILQVVSQGKTKVEDNSLQCCLCGVLLAAWQEEADCQKKGLLLQ